MWAVRPTWLDGDEAVVVGVVVAVRQSRRHGFLHDHSLAVGMEAVERDRDVTHEQATEVLGEEARDRLFADHVPGASRAIAVAFPGGAGHSASSVKTASI